MTAPTPHRGKATLRCGDVVDVTWWRLQPTYAPCPDHPGYMRAGQVVTAIEETDAGNVTAELGKALTMLDATMTHLDLLAEAAARVAREHPGHNSAMHSLIGGLGNLHSTMHWVRELLLDAPVEEPGLTDVRPIDAERNQRRALRLLRNAIADDGRDWRVDPADAFLFALLVGWSDDELLEVAGLHGWSPAKMDRIRGHRGAIAAAVAVRR